MTAQVYLSRRNLLALLSKLDRTRDGDPSECTVIKNDNTHARYPQSMQSIRVTAVEDADYYSDRPAGAMHPKDEPDVLTVPTVLGWSL